MDELMRLYAERLQKVYDERTAGDYSFLGILSEFSDHIVDYGPARDSMLRKMANYPPSHDTL